MAAQAGGDRPAGIGTRLRAAREKKGLTILQAAEKLHVDPRIVEALETEDFAALGAAVYARGHLRHYAELVNEKTAELQELYSNSTRAAPAQPDLTRMPHRPPDPNTGKLVGPTVVVLVAIASIGTVWWLMSHPTEKRLPALVHHRAQPTPLEPDDSGASLGEDAPGGGAPVQSGATPTGSEEAQPAAPAPTSAPKPAPRATPTTTPTTTPRPASTTTPWPASTTAPRPASTTAPSPTPATTPGSPRTATPGSTPTVTPATRPATTSKGADGAARGSAELAGTQARATGAAPPAAMPASAARPASVARAAPTGANSSTPGAATPAPSPRMASLDLANKASSAAAPPTTRAKESQLTLKFSSDSWAEVYDAAGQRLFYDVGAASTAHTVKGAAPMRIVLGNGAGVALEFNGRPAPIPATTSPDGSVRFVINAHGRPVPATNGE